MNVKMIVMPHAEELPLPSYATVGSSGLDLCAAIVDSVVLMAGERKMIPTGIKMSIPSGFEGQVRPRSGNAIKKGLTVLNTPGTIDSDYTGEICVILVNLGSTFQTVSRGDKIAQLVVCPITRVNLVQTTEFEATIRGEGGFGSTDRK